MVRIKKSRQAKAKVVHINRLKHYTGEQSLDWFVDTSLTGNIESGGKTSKDWDIIEIIAVIKRLDHCVAVKDVERNRKDIRLKMSVGNCSTGTDELGRGRCSAGTAEQKGYYVYL